MSYGTIVKLVAKDGYGFVKDEVSGVEHFFHKSAAGSGMFEMLRIGDRAWFEPENGLAALKGPRAKRLRFPA